MATTAERESQTLALGGAMVTPWNVSGGAVFPTGSSTPRTLADWMVLLANVSSPTGIYAQEDAGFIYFAHRGLPSVYPENTLDAYRRSVAAGAQFIECDTYLLRDGSLGIMHDATVDRTTTSSGNTADFSSMQWDGLVVDASDLLGTTVQADTRPPFLAEVLAEFGNKVLIGPEAKNIGSGAAIVSLLQRYGIAKDMAIVQSFTESELSAAITAGYPTMMLYGTYAGSPTPAALAATGYRWIGVASATSTAQMDALRAAGLKVSVYALNDRTSIAAVASHCDGVFTDDEIYVRGIARLTADPFDLQTWYHGHQASSSSGGNGGRGEFYSSDYWGMDLDAGNTWGGSLMGWASPLGGAETCPSVVIDYKVKFESAFAADRFSWVSITNLDTPITTDTNAAQGVGYMFAIRKTGALQIYETSGSGGGGAVEIAVNTAGAVPLSDGDEATMRITVTPTQLTFARLDGTPYSCTVADVTSRNAYLHMGVKGVFAKYRDVAVTI